MNAIESLGWTHYINAFTNGHFDVVYIYWGSIDMNAKHSLGWTPFMNAYINGHKDVVKLFCFLSR